MKNQKMLVSVLIIVLFGLLLWHFGKPDTQAQDYKNTAYLIEENEVILKNGVSETHTENSSASIITTYFGNELFTDLNNDDREDVVFLLTQQTGGSGTFYYAVAALNTENGYVGSDGYFLGDRIAPQSTNLSQNPQHKNVVVINYADRAPSESMATQPSIGKSAYLKLDPESMQWAIVEPNFEGEADTNIMTISMKSWTWLETQYNNDTVVTPNDIDAFTITFNEDGTFSATTDCNLLSGSYTSNENTISFDENIAMTKKYCADSQENEFVSLLSEIQSFFFTSKGNLIFDLKFDSGSAIFK